MANILWTGTIDQTTYRVVDAGSGNNPRLTVESRGQADAMGVQGWQRFEPIPTKVFEGILFSSGVLT